MDTVPPFIASSEDDDFVYGRGACDAKGIIASQIAAGEKLRAAGVSQFGLLFTVDEEVTSVGAKVANEHPLAAVCEYLINGEPTDNRLASGTKGSLQASITAAGRAAHSAYPEQGESAIEKLLDVLADIRKVKWPSDNVFGDTTCNIGLVSGGTRANIIPSEAVAILQLRLAIDATTAKDRLEEAIAGRAAYRPFLARSVRTATQHLRARLQTGCRPLPDSGHVRPRMPKAPRSRVSNRSARRSISSNERDHARAGPTPRRAASERPAVAMNRSAA